MNSPRLRFKEFDEDWKFLQLREIVIALTSGSRDWAQHYSKTGSKFIRMTNLSRDGIQLKLDDLKFVDIESDSADGKRTSLIHGDILISITAELGKIGWIPPDFGEAFINQHTALVRIDNAKADSRCVAYLLSTTKLNKEINRMNDAGAKAGLNLPTIKAITFQLPAKQEQTKIANFLTAIDEKITQLTQKCDLLAQYKKGVMQQIFSQRLRFKDDDGREFPEWEEKTLGEISQNVMYGMNSSAIPFDGKNKYIRITDIDDKTRTFSPAPLCSPSGNIDDKFKLQNGDIVFARTGASTGKCYVYNPKDGNLFFAGFLVKFSINHGDPYFIFLQTLTERYHSWVRIMSMRSGQPGINAEEYKDFGIYFPCLAEQTKIANFLTAIDDKITQAQTQLEAVKLYKKGLLQQMFV